MTRRTAKRPAVRVRWELEEYTLETRAPKSRVDELEEEASVLRSVVHQHSRDIEQLKHA